MQLDQITIEKVSEAGELLIRAAAVLGTLSPEQQAQLQQATDGNLPDSIAFAIQGARSVSKEVENSLRTHPPRGLVNQIEIGGQNELLALAKRARNIVDTSIPWKDKYNLIFSESISKRIFAIFKLMNLGFDYDDPDSDYEDDVLAFVRALESRLQELNPLFEDSSA